jgi:hypothetical protein
MNQPATSSIKPAVETEWESPGDCAMVLGISRSGIYNLIALGRLDARKILGRTVISVASRRGFAANLPKAEIAPKAARS